MQELGTDEYGVGTVPKGSFIVDVVKTKINDDHDFDLLKIEISNDHRYSHRLTFLSRVNSSASSHVI